MRGRSIAGMARMAVLSVTAVTVLSGCGLVAGMVRSSGGAETGATCSVLFLSPDASGSVPPGALDETVTIIAARLAAMGADEAIVEPVSPDGVRIVLPEGDDPAWLDAIDRTGEVAFVPVPPEFSQQVIDGEPLPAGMPVEPVFGTDGIASTSLSSDEFGRPGIGLTFTPEAAVAFDAYAAANQGQRFAIVVDGIVVSAPTINAPRFNGEAQISGSFTPTEAEALVGVLAAGPLPLAINHGTVGGPCPTP